MKQCCNFIHPMKYTLPLILVLCLGLIISCSKDDFNTSPDVRIEFSSDTLKFDTVFVSAGSVTKTLKIQIIDFLMFENQ